MKYIKTTITLFLLLGMFSSLSFAQSAKDVRLQKKTQVLEDMLNSFLSEKMVESKDEETPWVVRGLRSNSRVNRGSANSISSYLSDNGVYMRVNLSRIGSYVIGTSFPEVTEVQGIEIQKMEGNENQIVVTTNKKNADKVKSEKENKKEFEEKITSTLQEFLRDYTLVLSELDNDDIVQIQVVQDRAFSVSYGQDDNNFFTSTLEIDDDISQQISASVTMKAVRDFASGRINEAQFKTAVKIETNSKTSIPRDIAVFSEVFRSLYEREVTQNYFSSQNAELISLGDLGWSMKLKLYSSYRNGNGFDIVARRGQKPVDQETKDRFVLETYPDWVNEFKSYLIDYGMTLRSVDSKKKLIIEVQLPECKEFDEQMPDMVRLELDGKIVQGLRSGKLNQTKAVNQIQLEEIN